MALRKILCLVGSPTDQFHLELSELYARDCALALGEIGDFQFIFMHVSPDGSWRLPADLKRETIASTPTSGLAEILAMLDLQHFHMGLPQMFCLAGMTTYRAFFEIIGLPYLGNAPQQMANTADKWIARQMVQAAGVPVPMGELAIPHVKPALDLPFVVKPVSADNSQGVSLVRREEDISAAITRACEFGDRALVETFIPPGREMRCGTYETSNGVCALPPEEYFLDQESRAIRHRENKIQHIDGCMTLMAKSADESWIIGEDDPVYEAVQSAAIACHQALQCRQYGLFDFRIDDEDRVWFLEAGLYCSFSPKSVLCVMAKAAGIGFGQFFEILYERACVSPMGVPLGASLPNTQFTFKSPHQKAI